MHTIVGRSTVCNSPPWPGIIVTICVSCFMTVGPGKGHGMNKPPPIGTVQERSKGDTMCPTISQNPSRWHPSCLSNACATRKDPESEWLVRDNSETNPFTIKPETVSHVAEQSSWVPFPYCFPPRHPFPIKSLALSAHVSPQTIHFRVLDKSPLLGLGRSPPYCNSIMKTNHTPHKAYTELSLKAGSSHGYPHTATHKGTASKEASFPAQPSFLFWHFDVFITTIES